MLCCRIVNGIKNKNIKKSLGGNVECFAFGGATVRIASLEMSFHATNLAGEGGVGDVVWQIQASA